MHVKQAVPFFAVANIEASSRWYIDRLGFTMKLSWRPEGKLQWCWLEIGDAALMLQESHKPINGTPGAGVSRSSWNSRARCTGKETWTSYGAGAVSFEGSGRYFSLGRLLERVSVTGAAGFGRPLSKRS